MMQSRYTVPLKTVVEEMKLKPLHLSKDFDTALLTMADVNRPAMQLIFCDFKDGSKCFIVLFKIAHFRYPLSFSFYTWASPSTPMISPVT